MKKFGLRYVIMVGAMLSLFVNFIACGTQLYKVSLGDDYEPTSTRTASNPPSRGQGAPSNEPQLIHATKGWQNLPINFRTGTTVSKDQVKNLSEAMTSWEWAVGKKLFAYSGVHANTDGDTFPDLYSSLNDAINGDYMDFNWAKTKKKSIVLATTIWDNDTKDPEAIKTADIRFNGENYLLGDSLKLYAAANREVVDLESLALHELGHLLGLGHADEQVDSLSIMNPSLFIGEGLTSRSLSKGDIERIQQIYGCVGEACNIEQHYLSREENSIKK